MMVGLKGVWRVKAGIIPGQAMPEYTKDFPYTSEDKQADDEGGATGYAYHARFSKIRAEALDYYMQMSMPQFNNWASLDWFWF